jgi:hypothetical protein
LVLALVVLLVFVKDQRQGQLGTRRKMSLEEDPVPCEDWIDLWTKTALGFVMV